MKIRRFLLPTAVIIVLIGFVIDMLLIAGIIAVVIVIYSLLTYSGRKARIRYWFQGYQGAMRGNGNDEQAAMSALQQQFCGGKYANDIVCGDKEYKNLDTLIEHIITAEFKFQKLLMPLPGKSGLSAKGVEDFKKAKRKLQQEISGVRKEVLAE